MKKILIPFLISLCLSCTGLVLNYRHYLDTHHLLLARKTWGGECMNENGFGLNVFHTYGMTPEQADTVSLRFDPLSLILTILILTLILYGIGSLIKLIKEGRSQ